MSEIDPQHIPYLLELLDDESEEVQVEIVKQLMAFGPVLKTELRKFSPSQIYPKQKILGNVFERLYKTRLRAEWSSWFSIPSEILKLERALTLLADYLSGIKFLYQGDLSALLDQLADEYRNTYPQSDAFQLARFLFREKELRGAESDYYNPQNSNLNYVLIEKNGIPVSLCCIYMLVGSRLGIPIEGYHFPGHFMSRVMVNGNHFLVDCYHEGKVIPQDEVAQLQLAHKHHKDLPPSPINTEAIVQRILTNLINAFQLKGDRFKQQIMIVLYNEIDEFKHNQNFLDDATLQSLASGPVYSPGQIIRHTRYGYRGLVVEYTMSCQASDEWYFRNKTQPDRNQPWYHVLVHDTEIVTYAAQSNLIVDEFEPAIDHPLIEYFFTRLQDGSYARNNIPWPQEGMD